MDGALVALVGVLVVVGVWESVERVRARRRPVPLRVPAEQVRAEVLTVAAAGSDRDRIRAIRVLRERTGLGLVDAKLTVDRWLGEQGDVAR